MKSSQLRSLRRLLSLALMFTICFALLLSIRPTASASTTRELIEKYTGITPNVNFSNIPRNTPSSNHSSSSKPTNTWRNNVLMEDNYTK